MADDGRGDPARPAVELRASHQDRDRRVGSGSLTARPPSRSFWQWLLRRRRYAPPAAR